MTEANLGVAEAKRRFSELIDRVRQGERFLVHRRGKPVVALVSPSDVLNRPKEPPIGLAAVAGALSDWEDLEEVVEEIYAARSRARDRAVPELE
jgi:prevent-host-death family protein